MKQPLGIQNKDFVIIHLDQRTLLDLFFNV